MDPFATLQFLDLFAIGATMARFSDVVVRAFHRLPGLLVAAVTLGGLCVHDRLSPYMTYASAVLLVAASLAYPLLARFYALRPFVWLGERSFSLYLVHVPLLLAVVHALAGKVPLAVILAGALPLCLLGAEVFWLAVERPSMRLGRRLGCRLSQRSRTEATA